MDEPLRLEINVVRESIGQGLRDRTRCPKIVRFDELSTEAQKEIVAIISGMANRFDPVDRHYSFQLEAKK